MADGGVMPWRRQKNPLDARIKYADYGEIRKPLPKPPPGCEWVRDGTDWVLVQPAEAEALGGDPCAIKAQGGSTNSTVLAQDAQEVEAQPVADFYEHVVMPDDTLQGICLRYRTKPHTLRRHNDFPGDNFRMCTVLRIPTAEFTPGRVRLQGWTDDVKVQTVRNHTKLPALEARMYLEDHAWDVERAILACQADDQWEAQQAPPVDAQHPPPAPTQEDGNGEEGAAPLPVVVGVAVSAPAHPIQGEVELAVTATPIGTKC